MIGREKPKVHRVEGVFQCHLFHHFTRKLLEMRGIFDSQKPPTTSLGYDISLYKSSVNEKVYKQRSDNQRYRAFTEELQN